jgi:membrane protein DedA with SNARE-associated domain
VAEILNVVQLHIEQVIKALGYPGIALVMLIENLFPPIPSEIVMPFAGFLAADGGSVSFVGIVVAGTLGSVAGAVIIYWIGMWADEPVVRTFVRRYGRFFMLKESDIDRTLAAFERHGELYVFVGRLIPLVRSLISLPAGMQRMPFGKFLLFTTLGSALWTGILSYAGYVLGENWEQVLAVVDRYQLVTMVVLGVIVGYVVLKQLHARLIHAPSRSSDAHQSGLD